MKNYVTVLNHKYLPQLLALYESMNQHCGDFNLFVVCIDRLLYDQLALLKWSRMTLLDLEEIEKNNPRLAKIKSSRTLRSYCWTLASFSFSLVKTESPEIIELTYVDTDIFFFDSPRALFAELDGSGKSILITEHAYAAEYRHFEGTSGRFCVQFITVKYTDASLAIIKEWQNLCEECCSEEAKNGKFGDQKYLEAWPEKYGGVVHVLMQVELTQAPWNANVYSNCPVFFHFHSFRIIASRRFELFAPGHWLDRSKEWIFNEYTNCLKKIIRNLPEDCEYGFVPYEVSRIQRLREIKRMLWNHNIYRYKKV